MAQRQPAPKDKHLTRTVYEQLLEDILSGRRRPGEPLSELALTRELGVSRTPVHNAMLQLTKDGLVEQVPNCRPVVRGLTHKDIHEMFEMRILLEGETARLAANRMDAAPLARLHNHHEKVSKTQGSRKAWVRSWADYDEAFHHAIAQASGNQRLALDVSRYRLLHRGLNLYSFEETHAPLAVLRTAIEEHGSILDALQKKDAEAARDAMRMHLRRWQQFFAKLLAEEPQALAEAPNLILFADAEPPASPACE